MSVQTPGEIRDNVPGYNIELDSEGWVFVAKPVTEGLPVFTGNLFTVMSRVANEQGWPIEDIADTYNSLKESRMTP